MEVGGLGMECPMLFSAPTPPPPPPPFPPPPPPPPLLHTVDSRSPSVKIVQLRVKK